jgi:hypothetical protein
VIYVPLKWCGFAYKLFEAVLGSFQYSPKNASEIPENRLFAQFHASQTKAMKEQILAQALLFSKHCEGYFCNCCNWDGCGHTFHTASNSHWSTM